MILFFFLSVTNLFRSFFFFLLKCKTVLYDEKKILKDSKTTRKKKQQFSKKQSDFHIKILFFFLFDFDRKERTKSYWTAKGYNFKIRFINKVVNVFEGKAKKKDWEKRLYYYKWWFIVWFVWISATIEIFNGIIYFLIIWPAIE